MISPMAVAVALLGGALPALAGGPPYDRAHLSACSSADEVFVDAETGEMRVHAEVGPTTSSNKGCAITSLWEGGFQVDPGVDYEVTARLRLLGGEWAPRASVAPWGPGQLVSANEAVARVGVTLTPLVYGCSGTGECGPASGRLQEDILACQPFPWCESVETLVSPPPIGREITLSARVSMSDDYPIVGLLVVVRLRAQAEREGPPYEAVARGGANLEEIVVRRL